MARVRDGAMVEANLLSSTKFVKKVLRTYALSVAIYARVWRAIQWGARQLAEWLFPPWSIGAVSGAKSGP